MNEVEKNNVGASSISKAAKLFDDITNPIQAIKTASYLARQIDESEKSQRESKANPEIKKEIVPTGTEIEQDLKAGEYREIIGQDEKGEDRE